jgi:hypothetical protein
MKYRFRKIETVENLLEAIGRTDIPSTEVVVRRPAEDGSDMEIDLGKYTLTAAEEAALIALMKSKGMTFKEKR